MSSFDLRDALEGIKNIADLEIANDHDVSSMSLREVDDILSRAVDSITNDFSNVTEDDILDIYRSVLKGVMTSPHTISPGLMTKILDSLASAFTAAVEDTSKNVDTFGPDEIRERRQVLETYAFLLTWFVLGAEKYRGPAGAVDGMSAAPKSRRGRGGKAAAGGRGKKAAEWTWVEQIEPTLDLIVKVLKIRSQRIWTTTVDRSTVLEALMGPVYLVLENETHMKFEGIRANVYQAVCLAVKHHNHSKSAQIKLVQLLGYSDALADPVANLLAKLAHDYEHTALTEEFLREVAGKTWASTDSTGPKSFSRCLIRLGELAPRLVLKELSALQNHLDNDAYQMRNAIVEVYGALICYLLRQWETTDDADHTLKTIHHIYDALIERTQDSSSYVRSRVYQVLVKVLTAPNEDPLKNVKTQRSVAPQRMEVTMEACLALMDRTATVRKYALICLQTLLNTHTFPTAKEGDKDECRDLPRQYFRERYNELRSLKRTHEAALAAILRDDAPGEDAQLPVDTAHEAAIFKKKWSKKRRAEGDDAMEVDGEVVEDEEAESDDDADSIISDDGDESKENLLTTLDLPNLDEAQRARVKHEAQLIEKAQLYKKYFWDGLRFIKIIHSALKTARDLLGSKHKAEVLEAMELFRVAHIWKVSTAEAGMRKMIHLIWQKDNNAPPSTTGEEVVSTRGVRNRLLDTYESIYFNPQEKVQANQVAKEISRQMIDLTSWMSLAELTSLEELLRQMMDEDRIRADVIETLWEVYQSPRSSAKQRRGAIILLGMFALSKPSIVRDKQSILLKIGLGDKGKADLQLAKYTCIALQRMTGLKKKIKGSLEDNRQRYAMSNPVFRRLIDVLEAPTHDRAWFAFAEQALNAVYALAEKPEVVAERVIRDLTRRAFTSAPMPAAGVGGSAQPPQSQPEQEKEREERDPDAMETDDEEDTIKAKAQEGSEEGEEDRAATPQPQAAPGPSQASAVPGGDAGDAFGLSQMFFVVGHVAMKQIVHLELIEREMKRKKQEQEMAAKQGATQTEKEDEIEQVAGNAEDDIGELIKHVREEELLFGEKSLLKVYGPLLVYVCGSPQIYKDATLRSAATLSFAKFLCVSGKFCEEHHMLLFKILETSRDPNIRANIVIGIGDLAVSFATIIDERLNDLYMGLGADELIVKKNTLMVLTHLILNGMIKVKGQLAEMAKCIEDGEERVSDL
ncbi:ARM repeat-containing protein, partial [Peniophora sp. CONT]